MHLECLENLHDVGADHKAYFAGQGEASSASLASMYRCCCNYIHACPSVLLNGPRKIQALKKAVQQIETAWTPYFAELIADSIVLHNALPPSFYISGAPGPSSKM